MKKTGICILLLSMVLILCACADPMAGMVPMSADTFHMFDSVDQLKDYLEKSGREAGNDFTYYYVPAVLMEGSEAEGIVLRDDIYLGFDYMINVDTEYDKDEESYAYERMTRAEYTYILYNSGPEFLMTGYLNGSFELIEIDGKQYAYRPEYVDDKLVAHYLAFLYEEDVIQVTLPAIAPLEEMIKYAEVERVYIK